jgi:hypothetical protein
MEKETRPKDRGLFWLFAAGVLTVVLWRLPGGNYIVYPFTILATWFHEMGHGLTALALGGDFHQLLLYPDGSGLAVHGGHLFGGPLGRALVAAGGPIGPPVAGALLIIAGSHPKSSRLCLILLGLLLWVSALVWVRSAFGLASTVLLGGLILALAWKGSPTARRFGVQFLGVQACISAYLQIDYLFTRSAVVGGREMLTDTGQIAAALFLPFWFWGALLAVASLLLMLVGFRVAYR